MDKLKQQGRYAKAMKSSWRNHRKKGDDYIITGAVHVKEKDYGTFALGSCHPITNRYIKKLKEGLKVEYRAVKRGENHKIKQEIARTILEETDV